MWSPAGGEAEALEGRPPQLHVGVSVAKGPALGTGEQKGIGADLNPLAQMRLQLRGHPRWQWHRTTHM